MLVQGYVQCISHVIQGHNNPLCDISVCVLISRGIIMINPLLPTLYMYIGYEILSSFRISGNMFPQFYYCYVF